MGIFLHSCGAPETVQELSREAEIQMCSLGQTCLLLYAYDNLDIDLKHLMPTLERSEDTLVHLTSATMLPLKHGITLEDLKCSESLLTSSAPFILNKLTHRAWFAENASIAGNFSTILFIMDL